MDFPQEFQVKYDQLLEELRQIGEFRRGSVNAVYRKCGKRRCVCTQKDHPGHGPQITLTYKHEGKSRIKNLASVAAVEVVEKQVKNHRRFNDWRKKWVQLNEDICDEKLKKMPSEDESKKTTGQKKQKKRLSRRSGAKSKP
jgi:hypothetical protein